MTKVIAKFEARSDKEKPWIWYVFDHTTCNEILVCTVDSKGAAEDFHEVWAKDIAEFLNSQQKEVHI